MRHKSRHSKTPDHQRSEVDQDHGRGLRGRKGGHGGRAQRGDIRSAVLLILADGPAHGYQLMQTVSERTGGAWRPSPGAVYPALAQLESEGLLTIEDDGERRSARLTAAGHAYVEAEAASLAQLFDGFGSTAEESALERAAAQLDAAVHTIRSTGTRTQAEAAVAVLADARRALYLILADQD